jgi:hypothetical protein
VRRHKAGDISFKNVITFNMVGLGDPHLVVCGRVLMNGPG